MQDKCNLYIDERMDKKKLSNSYDSDIKLTFSPQDKGRPQHHMSQVGQEDPRSHHHRFPIWRPI